MGDIDILVPATAANAGGGCHASSKATFRKPKTIRSTGIPTMRRRSVTLKSVFGLRYIPRFFEKQPLGQDGSVCAQSVVGAPCGRPSFTEGR